MLQSFSGAVFTRFGHDVNLSMLLMRSRRFEKAVISAPMQSNGRQLP